MLPKPSKIENMNLVVQSTNGSASGEFRFFALKARRPGLGWYWRMRNHWHWHFKMCTLRPNWHQCSKPTRSERIWALNLIHSLDRELDNIGLHVTAMKRIGVPWAPTVVVGSRKHCSMVSATEQSWESWFPQITNSVEWTFNFQTPTW
jgi:hypothetical protein